MVYIAGWVATIFVLIIQAATRYRGKAFGYMLLCYFAMVAFLRGNVGTDTFSYESLVSRWTPGYIWNGMEPGFIALGAVLLAITSSPEIAVRAIALVFYALLFVFLKRANSDEQFLLIAYLVPAFAYQYSMNTLRIGIASAIVLLAAQNFRLYGARSALKTALSALLFHYSTLISLVYIFVSQRSWFRFGSFIAMFSLLLFTTAVFIAVDAYFLFKFSSYQRFESPGPLSGLSKLLPFSLILLGMSLGSLQRYDKVKQMVLGAVFLIVGWVLSRYTFAGLRILDVIAFMGPVAILVSYMRTNHSLNLLMKSFIVLAGIAAAAGVYRGFALGAGQGISPFLPYNFWF